MLTETKERLIKKTASITRFLELEKDEQEWLYPLLGQSEKTAIDVIESCTNRELTYFEIAEIVEINNNTAKQIVYALAQGGLNVCYSQTKACYANTGRKRKLAKIEK